MNDTTNKTDLDKEKINLETALIPWKELQRFFASGLAIAVTTELDLIEVAHAFSKDNKILVENWLKQGCVSKVSDQQAIEWIKSDIEVWAVVVKPWVLVQEDPSKERAQAIPAKS